MCVYKYIYMYMCLYIGLFLYIYTVLRCTVVYGAKIWRKQHHICTYKTYLYICVYTCTHI